MEGDTWDKFTESVAGKVAAVVEQRIAESIAKAVRVETKLVYSESHAAEWLGVSKDTLAAWRKRGLIDYAQYPKGRLPEGAVDGLSDLYTYSIVDLLNFRERYLNRTHGAKRFHLELAGVNETERRLRAA